MQTVEVSFIDNALTEMSEGDNRDAKIAALVQQQDHPAAANRVALTFTTLAKARKQARIDAVRQGLNTTPQVELKPEHMLSFVQKLMNKVCWNARRLVLSQLDDDAANGIDFSMDMADQLANLESNTMKAVTAQVNDDFSILNEVHSWFCSKCNYMTDLDPLYMFAQKEQVAPDTDELFAAAEVEAPEVWEFTHQLMDFNDIFPALGEIALQLQEKADDGDAEFAAMHSFGAKEQKAA